MSSRRQIVRVLLVVATVLPVACRRARPPALDVGDWLDRLVDLEWLAHPEPGVRCVQYSSYDRTSHEHGRDPETWRANGDSGHYLRVEPDGEAVMADVEGPGVITHIWSADPTGTIRLYFDDEETPRIEMGFADMFPADGQEGAFPFRAPFCYRVSGANCYLPIPFAKRVLVVSDRPHGHFYNIVVRRLPRDTSVETFPRAWSEPQRAAWRRAAEALSDPGGAAGGGSQEAGEVELGAGESAEILALSSEADAGEKVSSLSLAIESQGRFADRMVRLLAYWDGSERPSIDVPVGDLFCAPFGAAPLRSRLAARDAGWWHARWPMPFDEARFVVRNDGRRTARVKLRVSREPLGAPTSWRLHAGFRRENGSVAFDVPIVDVRGRGRFVGTVLSIDCPWTGWWGEGDEKVVIDGEPWPSWWGTGSEDYFNDAWGMHRHVRPFEGCPHLQGPEHSNKTSMYRWHVLDSIPFDRSARITIENYADRRPEAERVDYALLALWYQEGTGDRDLFVAAPAVDPEPRPRSRPHAREAEDLVASDDGDGAEGGVRTVSLAELEALSRPASELASGRGAVILPVGEAVDLPVPVAGSGVREVRLHVLPPGGPGPLRWRLGDREAGSAALAAGQEDVVLALARVAPPELPLRVEAGGVETGGVETGGVETGGVETGGVETGGAPGRWILDAVSLLPPPPREPGVVEAESLEHEPAATRRLARGASGWESLRHQGPDPLAASLPSGSDGLYHLDVIHGRGPDLGAWVLEVDGRRLPNGIEGRAAESGWSTTRTGEVRLRRGRSSLRFIPAEPGSRLPAGGLDLDALVLVGPRIEGALEGEALEVMKVDGGVVMPQALGEWLSGGEHAWVRFSKRGARVVFALPVRETDDYRVSARLVTSHDYARVQIAIDGEDIGDVVDTYTPRVGGTEVIPLGTVRLEAGTRRLSLTAVGRFARSLGYFVGLDWIALAPAGGVSESRRTR